MRFAVLIVGLLYTILLAASACAQEAGLVVEDVSYGTELDAFGQEVLIARGRLFNQDNTAYSSVSLVAEVYDDRDLIVGEGFGFLVTACGAGLLPNFALQPGERHAFAVTVEMYEADVEIERVNVTAQGTPADPQPTEQPRIVPGVEPIWEGDVAAVEWADDQTVRFGVGCHRDVFTNLAWHSYNAAGGEVQEITQPNAERVTDGLREVLGLSDPLIFNRSFLSFPPDAQRLVYQNDLNAVITAEPDGSFRRVLYDDLGNRTLQGIIWLPEGRFMAYYYGAYGDPVTYFTGSVEGQLIGNHPADSLPSVIVPGPSPDGARAVIAATLDDQPGYYEKLTSFEGYELLFAGDAPGNNWPPPLYVVDADGSAFIFVARSLLGTPTLQCFNMQTHLLRDLSPLPLNLTSEERAVWALSPEGSTIALAANGLHGGLWLLDLTEFPACE